MIKTILTSNLFKSAGVYTFSRIINSAIPFLMLPILTRYLTPTDYGIVAMYAIMVSIVSPFVGLNIHGAIGVRYFHGGTAGLPRYIGNALCLMAASSLLVTMIMWLFGDIVSKLTAFPRDWLWTVVLFAVGQFVVRVLLMLWQVENKPFKYGVFQNLQTMMNVGLSILLVVGLGRNWQGRVEAQVISILFFAAIALYVLKKNGWLQFSYNKEDIRGAMKFGVPLIPHEIGSMLITQTDRMFITNMVGVAAAGVYTVGFQVGSIIELVAGSFNQAYSPWLYRQLSQNDEAKKLRIVKLTYLYFVLILLFALGLSLIVPWFLGFFVGKDFVGAGRYTFWIVLGFAFSGMYYMVANYIVFAEKTAALAWVTFFTAIVNIICNYLLIRLNGPVGAAQASALAFFLSFVFTWILSARVYEMPWGLKGAKGGEIQPE